MTTVLLEQGEERFHGGVVAVTPTWPMDPISWWWRIITWIDTHLPPPPRPNRARPGTSATAIVPAVAVDETTGDVAASGDRRGDSVNGQSGLNPVADGVPDDPAREDVLACAEVELAVAGGMFDEVGHPGPVRSRGAKFAADLVVMGWRSGPRGLG